MEVFNPFENVFLTILAVVIVYVFATAILNQVIKSKPSWSGVRESILTGIILLGVFATLYIILSESGLLVEPELLDEPEPLVESEFRKGLLNLIGTIVLFGIVYYIAKEILDLNIKRKSDWSVIRVSVLFVIVFVGLISVIFALPIKEDLQMEIFKLLGVVISAMLALSSTSFIGNGLAGVMLQTINSFRPGDFIRVNDYFGRVTERRLFHTEINMEDGDLMTIPNLYLATNAVKVTKKASEKVIDKETRVKGPFLSGVCSLGYDVNKEKVADALLKAADKAGLEEAFVRILELGDYAVTYKVYGMFTKDGHLMMKAQSTLNAMILEALHNARIEIVSPAFMNQRQVGNIPIIPDKIKKKEKVKETDEVENILYDKSIKGEAIEEKKEKLEELGQKLENLEQEVKTAETEEEKEKAKIALEEEIAEKERIEKQIAEDKEDMNSEK